MSSSTNSDVAESHEEHTTTEPKRWYRTSMFNAVVIGMVGFLSPGLWNSMNSLGAGGEVNMPSDIPFSLIVMPRCPETIFGQRSQRFGIWSDGLLLSLRRANCQSYRPQVDPGFGRYRLPGL